MPKFDSRAEYENWKAENALKRFGRAELARSDQEWARKGSDTEKTQRRGWTWGTVLALVIILCVLYAYTRG